MAIDDPFPFIANERARKELNRRLVLIAEGIEAAAASGGEGDFNVDGGTASSVYLSTQLVDGGSASG